MQPEAVKQEEWEAVVEKVEQTSATFSGEMAIADHTASPLTNFYFLEKRGGQDRNTFISRVQFNKGTRTWGKITPIELEAQYEGESTHLACQRFNNGIDDTCAMSTNGATVYKTAIPSAETSDPSIKCSALIKLRISGENVPAKIQLGGDYVLVATRPMKSDAAPKLMVWTAPF